MCRRYGLRIVALAAAVLVAGCQDLAVTNPNNPDRGRVTSTPEGVEALVSSAFLGWWEWTHDDSPVWVWSTTADEFSSAFFDFGILETSSEPRASWNNSPLYGGREASQDPWYGLHEIVSNVNDAFAAMNRGIVVAESARARVVGRFTQGLALGMLALAFDSAFITNEHLDLDTITAVLPLRPSRTVMDTALARLDEAIAIAQANTFNVPGGTGWFFTSMTSQNVARLAHSFSARFLAAQARNRAARQDSVDWNLVISHIDQGIQADFSPQAVPEILVDDYKRVAARQRGATPGDFARADSWLVGPADSTDRMLNWVNLQPASRTTFTMITKDRRIHGSAGPTSTGAYFGYTTRIPAASWATRGTYHQSNYYFKRFGRGTAWQDSLQPALTVAEMNLLKAEALIRLDRAPEAVPLINLTRVANGQLPPVTIDGPPDSAGCVPRKVMPGPMQGQCGSLWDALRYEKRIEVAGVDPTVPYTDARGWQALVQNTFVQFPVPGRELETLRRPLYTYGGGLAFSAPIPDPERCPILLPRCPPPPP
jgi:hypothetical protein